MKYITAFFCLFYFSVSYADKQKIWLIGGGNVQHNSQQQIEKNVLWLDRIFKNHTAKDNYKVYFSSGNDTVQDVLYWSVNLSQNEIVLQRVFNKKAQTGLSYKHHSLAPVNGSTKKTELVHSLSSDFKQVSANMDILFVYNGHGGREYNNEQNNYLKLWGDTRLSVSELGNLFSKAPQSSTVRFILTQCYSGAFYNLLQTPQTDKALNGQLRCGFMAESEFRQSEGCTLETNPDEFRDYTTYFFAALSGKSRTGESLLSNPDINADNKISFWEAHLYTLKSAKNKDLSRSSSEVFLEKWQPWFLRWQRTGENKGSVYWRLAQDVASSNKLPSENQKLSTLRPAIVDELASTQKNINVYEKKIKSLQKTIQRDLQIIWPNLNYSIATGLSAYKNNEEDIVRFIKRHKQYIKLLNLSALYLPSLTLQLKLERKLAQVDKIYRLKRIAWLEQQLFSYASENEIKQYNDLLNCEKTGFL